MITPFPGEKENWSLITTYSTPQELHDLCTKGNLIKNLSDYEADKAGLNNKGFLYCHKGILMSYFGTTGPLIHRRQRDHAENPEKRVNKLLKGGDVEFWVAPLDGSEKRRMGIENYYIFMYKHIYNLINDSFTLPSYNIRIERSPILTAPSIFDAITI